MPNILQNDSISTREAAPLKKLEPESFLKELEACQTNRAVELELELNLAL